MKTIYRYKSPPLYTQRWTQRKRQCIDRNENFRFPPLRQGYSQHRWLIFLFSTYYILSWFWEMKKRKKKLPHSSQKMKILFHFFLFFPLKTVRISLKLVHVCILSVFLFFLLYNKNVFLGVLVTPISPFSCFRRFVRECVKGAPDCNFQIQVEESFQKSIIMPMLGSTTKTTVTHFLRVL